MGARATIAAAVLGASSVAVPNPPGGVEGIPPRALEAYLAASAGAPCDLPWWDLAAIGAVETGHGTYGGAHLNDDGKMTVMAVSYADAYGPLQFILPTWDRYGSGDINDIDDAAPATARMLCADGYERDRMDAFEAYNGGGYRGSETREYAAKVDEFAQQYQRADRRDLPSKPATGKTKERSAARVGERALSGWLNLGRNAQTIGLGSAWTAVDDWLFGPSEAVTQRLTDARADGLDPEFGGRLDRFLADAPGSMTVVSGFRSSDEQMVQRRKNCPDPVGSDSTECSPWTAKPGTSDHERGLAADLSYGSDVVMAWAHAHAADYGLQFDVPGEDWHVSLRQEFR